MPEISCPNRPLVLGTASLKQPVSVRVNILFGNQIFLFEANVSGAWKTKALPYLCRKGSLAEASEHGDSLQRARVVALSRLSDADGLSPACSWAVSLLLLSCLVSPDVHVSTCCLVFC